MFEPASSAENPSVAERSSDALHHRDILNELIDMAADLARLVHRQATTPADAAPSAEPVATSQAIVAYDRITRTIRQTVLLVRRLEEDRPAEPSRVAARRRVIRVVEDVIQRSVEGDEAERLTAEFMDRLDAPELDDEIGARPVGEIIDDICRDLGLTAPWGAHPWKRRTPEEVAVLFRRAARSPRSAPPRSPAPRPGAPGSAVEGPECRAGPAARRGSLALP